MFNLTPTDSSAPGEVLHRAATAIGAIKGAIFEVRPGEHFTHAIELRSYFPRVEGAEPTAQCLGDGLRQYIIPTLMADSDAIIDVPDQSMVHARRFVLVILARDSANAVRGVGAVMVECRSHREAEHKLKQLQDMFV